MSKTLIVAGSILFMFMIGLCSVVGTNNNLIKKEQALKAQYEQNQNVYDNYWKKVKEIAQVPDMYADKLKDVYTAAIEGRYGKSGMKAQWAWVKEQNPQFSDKTFIKIQQVMEGGRKDFENNQKILLDMKRDYETSLGVFPNNMVAGFLGFPKIDLKKIGIVTSEKTEDVFKSKKDNDIVSIK